MPEPRPGDPVEGEYTDSELPLDAELPKEDVRDADLDDDLDEVEVVEIVEESRDDPPGRGAAL